MIEAAVFVCSICGEPSTDICAGCTKDACLNHRCQRCLRCSDCCECEVPLSAPEPGRAEKLEESATPVAAASETSTELAPSAEPNGVSPLGHPLDHLPDRDDPASAHPQSGE